MFASFRALLGDELYELVQRRDDEAQAGLLAALISGTDGYALYVAEHAGAIAGFVAIRCNPDTLLGELGLNAVDPELSRQGIGTKMYEFATALMKKAGMKAAVVSTGGDTSHAAARRAYTKAGFQASIPSLWMCRKL